MLGRYGPAMKLANVLEQHIAVFGGSGSGKTVMLSSFYGAAQEPEFLKESVFRVVADDIGQGSRLHRNFLGMRDAARLPTPTRFAATSYSFAIKLKDGNANAAKAKPFDSLRLVWHDYPGEWFEQDVSGPEEAQRRIDTFRSLLVSDVAVLLVDGQRLMDNAGDEERYLKSLLGNIRNGLLSLKDELLEGGRPLEEFPRIWIMALTKADLLPEMDVFGFRDLLIHKACDDLDELRKVLAEFVDFSAAMSVGEDFILLSSAEFGTDRIEVTKRVGLDLILPVSAIVPLERYVQWAEGKKIAGKAADALIDQAGPLALALLGKIKLPGKFGLVWNLVGSKVAAEILSQAAKLGGEKLKERHQGAVANQDSVATVLTQFKLALDQGEAERTLFRSLG